MKKFKNNPYLIASLLFSVVVLAILYLFFGWQTEVDTVEYLQAMNSLLNKDFNSLNLIPHRILRPLGVILPLPFTTFFCPLMSLIFVNILFYFGTVYLIFKIAKEIFKKEEKAFYSVVFYITTYPLLRNGPVALTDMGSWFSYILSIYLTLSFLKEPRNYLVYLNGLICGIGVLIKENGGMGILFFFAILLISRKFPFKKITNYTFKFFLIFIFPILINQLLVYHYFNYTYFHWYLQSAKIYLKGSYTLFNLAKNFFIVFGFHWVFVLIGVWKVWQEKNKENNKIYLALLIPSLSFFLWPCITARLIYIAGPLFSLIAAKGLESQKSPFFLKGFLFFSIIFNFILVKLSYIV